METLSLEELKQFINGEGKWKPTHQTIYPAITPESGDVIPTPTIKDVETYLAAISDE